MAKNPIVRQRRQIADTGIFNLEEIDLEFANGQRRCYQRIVGSAQGAVLVVPLLNDDTLLLIREYAAGMDRYELGFPKGKVEENEDILDAANREIREETGYASGRLQLLRSVSVAPGYLYHITHIVLARDLHPAPSPGDEPEPIEVVPWPLDDLDRLFGREDFTEARSIAALLLMQRQLASEAGSLDTGRP